MKHLPCPSCGFAVGPKPRYEPLLVGYLAGSAYRYRCGKCGTSTQITQGAFLALPKLTPEQVHELVPGLSDSP